MTCLLRSEIGAIEPFPFRALAIVEKDGLEQATAVEEASGLSHTLYQLNGFRKSTPSQNHQLVVLISNSKQYVDDFVEELRRPQVARHFIYRGISLTRKRTPIGPYRSPMPRVLGGS